MTVRDWFCHLFGPPHPRQVPIHIKEALDTAAEAGKATEEARVAVDDYWNARTDDLIDQYETAEARRKVKVRRGH